MRVLFVGGHQDGKFTEVTEKQFEEVCESVLNGNWQQAAKECDDFGLYASDLVQYQEAYELDEMAIVSMGHIARLVERASKYRFTST